MTHPAAVPGGRVPEVCAHSLRGLHATLATEAGATAEAVAARRTAAQLGHGSTEVTAAHYTRAEATEAARQRAVMRTLQNRQLASGSSHV